jgi:hypothetical protein
VQREDAVVVITASPAAADGVIRSWQESTGGTARHAVSGREFAEPSSDATAEANPG